MEMGNLLFVQLPLLDRNLYTSAAVQCTMKYNGVLRFFFLWRQKLYFAEVRPNHVTGVECRFVKF